MDFSKFKFKDLVDHKDWAGQFIGYGNPNAEILIVGQEAGYDIKDIEDKNSDYNKFYKPNQEHWWKMIHDSSREYIPKNLPKEVSFDKYQFPDYFVPTYPFYQQPYKLWYNLEKDGKTERLYATTYYWYQRLICNIFGGPKPEFFNFWERAFITELNGTPRKSHCTPMDVEANIKKRFDMMKETKEFWSHFQIVIFACGKYADAINIKGERRRTKDTQQLFFDIFGSAEPFYCKQLSRNHAKSEMERISAEISKFIRKQ